MNNFWEVFENMKKCDTPTLKYPRNVAITDNEVRTEFNPKESLR